MKLHTSRSVKPLAAIGLALSASLVLAGCATEATEGDATNGDVTSVPVGSSAEVYAEALADMEPITLVYQNGGSPEARTSAPVLRFQERVAEYSGGKIEIEVAWVNAVVPNVVEIDRALQDGRLDIGVVYSSLNAEEYPIGGLTIGSTVTRDPRVLAGTLASAGAFEETILETPEAVAEFTDNGLTPLYMFQPESPTVLFCKEPLTSLADLQGKQIRAATPAMAIQLEGLGAIPVSMAYNEVYEALQRGILDCGMGIHGLGTVVGLFEVAPFVMHTQPGAAFSSTPTPYYAGVRFLDMPDVAQQLVKELFIIHMGEQKEIQVQEIVEDGLPMVEQYGGAFLTLESDVTEKLAEINETILEDIRTSPLFDGEDFLERLAENQEKWLTIVEDLGYLDRGPVEELGDWYTTDLGSGFTEVLAKEITPLSVVARP